MKHIFIKLFSICLLTVFFGADVYSQTIQVNQERLTGLIHELSTYGKNDAGGSDRVAYSTHDIAARKFLLGKLEKLGLEVSIDFAGNVIAKKTGSNPKLKPIAFGSHIDEVPNGGDYDGPVGSMGAIEVMQTLIENNVTTLHPLELILFTNEEGGVVGSRAIAGQLSAAALTTKSSSGLTQSEGIRAVGGNPDRIMEVKREKGDIAAFLELHIEQGGNLEKNQKQIGVVEGIVAIEWWQFTFKGTANHAGTTPMNMRKDPMLPAAKFILAVNETVNSYAGAQVGTVGKIEAFPGAGNVIPGEVTLNLELRDLSSEKIWKIYSELESKAKTFAEENGTELQIVHQEVASEPAMANPVIQKAIENSASTLGLSTMYLPSGAGHDAQEMARIGPIGMIFIPSKNGISHSPQEYSSPEDIANGANVLLQTILRIDKELD
ncbi:M20 family metallo-hydrolase [Algoriphagus winogradskyi]|uniref:N-carbamoyl-L-amino-acid hydrolase n=1 Tax=Algoriphagus winogradskyi TaxID=237017 RepID=A0ABY1PI96_9BACT|nr:M20 family metallo-hydrolase [Algoriphagus winogradskyi]SMP35006.1 N-carbamoyl-L-amino-acid hydrolase [Algoriphagus winogradskyi]